MALILIVSLSLSMFAFVWLTRKREYSKISASMFTLFLFLCLLFIFNPAIELNIPYFTRNNANVLIDESLSVQSPQLFSKLYRAGGAKFFYFADRFSSVTNDLNPEYTSLYDSISSAVAADPKRKWIVFSDFNDNYSLESLSPNSNIIPVVVDSSQPLPDASIYSLDVPETIAGNENTAFGIEIYSRVNAKAVIQVKLDDKPLLSKEISLIKGIHPVRMNSAFEGKGFHSVHFVLKMKNNTDSVQTQLIQIIPEFNRILFIAGRPSEEFASVKRFIDQLKWIKLDVILIKKKDESIAIPSLSNYSGLILMDIKDRQIKNLLELSNAVQKNIPVFYQTGQNEFHEMRKTLALFTNALFMENFGERKWIYNNEEHTVKTGLDSGEILLNVKPSVRLFFGWDTWLWDFKNLPYGLSTGDFADFWQNQVHFLLQKSTSGISFQRLNYTRGDLNPLSAVSNGEYSLFTNGGEMKLRISDNPKEVCPMSPNIQTAMEINSNYYRLDQIKDLTAFIRSVKSDKTALSSLKISVSIRDNLVIFLIMAASLILFWFLRDIDRIRS